MGGVELAPPRRRPALGPAGLRGRRRAGRAAASARRRRRAHAAAHDHVATSSTGSSTRSRDAIDEVTDAVTLARLGRRPKPTAIRRGRPLARAARPRRRRARGRARRPTADRRVVRVERLPRPHPAPGGRRRRARRARPVGHRHRLGPADRRLAPRARRARDARSRTGSAPSGAVLFPTGFAANLGVLTHASARPRRARLLRRAQPRVDHRRLPPARADGRRVPPPRPRPPRRAARAHAAPARGRRHRHRVLDGRRRAPTSTPSPSSCARHGALLVLDEAHAVLGPDLDARRDVDVLRVGTLSKTLGALGGFVAGPRALIELVVNRARSVHLHDRADPGRHRRGARRARRVALRPRATRWSRACARTSSASAPGHPSPIIPFVCGEEAAALAAASALLGTGPARSGDPAADRRRRARRACGSRVSAVAHRRPDRRAGCARSTDVLGPVPAP